MSTKSTIYLQAMDDKGEEYFHLYYDISGVYRKREIHIDVGSDVVFIKDPEKLINELTRVWTHIKDEYETRSKN